MDVVDLIDKFSHKDIVFVVGAGPSLHWVDVKQIARFPIIAVNSAIMKFAYHDFDNLFFLADDIGVKNFNYFIHVLPKLNCISLLYKKKLERQANHLDPDSIVWFDHKWYYDPSSDKYNPQGLEMTKGEPIIGSRTSSGSAVHFAHIFGAKTIVLLGMDCCYHGMKRYYWQFWDKKDQPYRLNGEKVFSFPNHGYYQGKPIDSHSSSFLHYWSALAKQADSQGINIINASGGILDCFKSMTVEQVLDTYG